MPQKQHKFRVIPLDGREEFTVDGTHIEHNDTSGATIIYDGQDIVARILNANVVRNSTTTSKDA